MRRGVATVATIYAGSVDQSQIGVFATIYDYVGVPEDASADPRPSITLTESLLPPDDLTAIASWVREKCGLELVVVNKGLRFEDEPEAFEVGLFAGHVINP
jgi:hypothetical protein